jgi:lipoprotein-anchoring transpeptidase ErfK/SrfK
MTISRRAASAVATAMVVCLLLGSSTGKGSDLPPWRDADDLPMPEGAGMVATKRPDQPILMHPLGNSARRGTTVAGIELPLFGAKRGAGCASRWLNVGPMAWICQDAVDLRVWDPDRPPARRLPAAEGLPFRYFFVGAEAVSGYSRLEDAEDVAPDQELQAGFAVAIVDEGVKDSTRYGKTHRGLWVPMRDLRPVTPTVFHGEDIVDGHLDFGWVVTDRAAVTKLPSGAGAAAAASKRGETKAKFEKVPILDEKPDKKPTHYRIGEDQWVRIRDVRRPTRAQPPPSVRAGERWIDVDLASQTLVAYEGDRPVFATLVSTGKGKEGTEQATPKGESRIWVKLESSSMDNLEDEQADRYYAIEDVPYVQFFSKGVGLHGAFWHRDFGRVRSHGCVNLAPLDAQRLFEFTSPHLPAGWTAVLPTDVEPGTIVRVR